MARPKPTIVTASGGIPTSRAEALGKKKKAPMKTYFCKMRGHLITVQQELKYTQRVGDSDELVMVVEPKITIQFQGHQYSTDDPVVQEAIESSEFYGSIIYGPEATTDVDEAKKKEAGSATLYTSGPSPSTSRS